MGTVGREAGDPGILCPTLQPSVACEAFVPCAAGHMAPEAGGPPASSPDTRAVCVSFAEHVD